MNTKSSSSTPAPQKAKPGVPGAADARAWQTWSDESVQEQVQPLSREQVVQLGLDRPAVSVWSVLLWQTVAGLVVAAVLGGVSGRWAWAVSALYGAASVVLPALVFARGLTGRLSSLNAATAVMGFFVWEFIKIGLTFAMLLAAPRLVADLSWPALLAGLVVTMKVVWLAVWMQSRRSRSA